MGDIVIYTGWCMALRGKRGRVVRTEPVCQAPDFIVPDENRKSLIVEIMKDDLPEHWPRHWHRYRCQPDEIRRELPDIAR